MQIYFIFIIFCLLGEITSKIKNDTNSSMFGFFLNVKTVLFKEEDLIKTCWNTDEINLLVARRIMQDLVPKGYPSDFKILYEYVQKCIFKINQSTKIMKMALFDALGGYLYSVAIPVLNEAFYAGNVGYEVTAGIHEQLAVMMDFLNTDGTGWIEPCDTSKIPTTVAALPLKMCNLQNACQSLIQQPTNISSNLTDIKIPLPYLDDDAYPSSVAVPLQEHSLFSLTSECSVNIIPKYYIIAMRCLVSYYENEDILNFNHQLHKWILTRVVPHLYDLDRWYPGFGGVMRIIETMNQKGLASSEIIKIYKINRTTCSDLASAKHSLKNSGLRLASISDEKYFEKWTWKSIILLIAIILLILWLIFCIIWIIRIKIKKRQNQRYVRIKGTDSSLVNTLISLYNGIDSDKETKIELERSRSNYSKSTTGTYSDYNTSSKSSRRSKK